MILKRLKTTKGLIQSFPKSKKDNLAPYAKKSNVQKNLNTTKIYHVKLFF